METDSLFYRLFKEKPNLLFELLGEKIPKTTYTFGSYEVKQTSLRSDGILQPVRSTKSPIFFLENQGYKFSQLSREEIAAMLGVTKELRESRFYRDIKEEVKDELLAEAIPMLLQGGFSIEDIADRLKITIEQVRQFAQAQN